MATLAFVMVVMAMHGRMVAVLEDAAQRRGWHVPRRRAKLIISSGVVEGKLERLLGGGGMDRFGGIQERAKLTVNWCLFTSDGALEVAADISLDCR